MKTLVLDPSYGCAGDMILGALVAAGVDFEMMRVELEKLNLDGYTISAESTTRNHIAAMKVNVDCEEQYAHRHLHHIKEIIDASSLSGTVKSNAEAIFKRLAEAEAAVHATSIEKVHFHEVGAIDAIVDIVGACIAVEMLDVGRIVSRPVALGSGMVKCAHGNFPLPAPATANLVRGFPVRMYTISSELTTPTGAAIVTTLANPLLGPFEGSVRSVGYGAGSREFGDHPNLMRVFVLDDSDAIESDTVAVLETNIDDMNPEVYSGLFEKLLTAGVLEVYLTPVQMKKNRPGQLLTVLCELDQKSRFERLIFEETTTSGIRSQVFARSKLPRHSETVETPLGEVEVKVFEFAGRRRVVPEYESVKTVADSRGISYLAAHDAITDHINKTERES